jgi:hypothetical protein
VSFVLENFNESGKAQLAVSSVLLGLLPTILGIMGSNATGIGILALQRPLFAMLSSFGAPLISSTRSFEYRHPVEMMQTKSEGVPAFTGWSRLVYFAKYATTGVAIANVAHVVWQLCLYSLCVFSGNTWWLPAL